MCDTGEGEKRKKKPKRTPKGEITHIPDNDWLDSRGERGRVQSSDGLMDENLFQKLIQTVRYEPHR